MYFVTTDLRLGYKLKEYTQDFQEKRFLWYECILENLLNEQGKGYGAFFRIFNGQALLGVVVGIISLYLVFYLIG